MTFPTSAQHRYVAASFAHLDQPVLGSGADVVHLTLGLLVSIVAWDLSGIQGFRLTYCFLMFFFNFFNSFNLTLNFVYKTSTRQIS
jgi:hypothetical protein